MIKGYHMGPGGVEPPTSRLSGPTIETAFAFAAKDFSRFRSSRHVLSETQTPRNFTIRAYTPRTRESAAAQRECVG